MIKKLYYKFFKSKEKYSEFKLNNILDKQKKIFDLKLKFKLEEIENNIRNKNELNFLHSGHCGDLIYSLPLIKKLSFTHKCNLLIGVGKKVPGGYLNHPAKDVFIDERMFNLIHPLIKHQKYINNVKKFENDKIDVDLNIFREFPISINFNSCKWYFHITGIKCDLSETFLDTNNHNEIKNKIVILRSFRARNHLINYKFLNNFNEEFIFVGLKEEFEDLKKQIPKLIFYNPKDFFEMSQIIKSSKFFIGNQSLAFAIAEGLKVPRILENRPDFPVVQPIGGDCRDFYFQTHFEKYFKYFVEKY